MSLSVWKFIASTLLTIVLTLGGAYAAMNRNAVTKSEVREMVEPDRELLRQTLEEVKELRQDVAKMNREIGEIKGMLGQRR